MYIASKEKHWYRLWSYIKKTDGCWLWCGTPDVNGYGQFRAYWRRRQAHIVVFEIFRGGIPWGKELDHLCRNRLCVNPAHLEPVTHRENILRGHTVPARNAAKTHCKRGHLLAGQNLRINPKGERICKACDAMRSQQYKKAKRENRN